jgi:uncharacterized protein YcnI
MRKRLGATVALAIVAVVVFASPALAHVTIEPSEATAGTFVTLRFNVPNEQPLANTVKFEVKFDTFHSIPEVQVKAKAGWTPQITKTDLGAPLETDHGAVTEAVSQISWSGGTIAPGQFDDFEVLVGPLPAGVDALHFPATQTYSDGSAVQWDEQTFADRPAPQHPVPTLTLNAAGGKKEAKSSSDSSNLIAIAALLVGAAGLGLGFYAWSIIRRWR